MQTVLIVIHFLVVITLVGVVLLQPSEDGGFGAGSGSGFMRTRGTKNALTRLTAILAFCFFAVSIGLTVVGSISNSSSDILNRIPTNSGTVPSLNDKSQPSILEQLGGVSAPGHGEDEPTAPVDENPVPSSFEESSSTPNNESAK
ncbi:preprotein translocase subunit SecG [Bartonella sp. CB178]|uniref:preprotein translocase subunit SecG n=1 Tax=Bartonella sp. CB178 TaxID=3112255 RepID=UPI00300DDDA4